VTYPGSPVPGGYGRPPLDPVAAHVISQARQRFDGTRQPSARLTAEDDKALQETLAENKGCRLCGGIHANPHAPETACPRLKTFRCNADGKVTEAEYWPWPETDWTAGRVILPAVDREGGTDDGQVPG
jgi:hypothetical protein